MTTEKGGAVMTSFTPDRTARPAHPSATPFTHNMTFQRDTSMHQVEIHLADIRERHERHRVIRHAERHGQRHGAGLAHAIRLRLGESLMRLGRRVGGEALTDTLTTPAWQG